MKKVNTEARISLNKLGEYVYANPARRKKIIEDQKYPQPFMVTRYSELKNGLIDIMSLQDFSLYNKVIGRINVDTSDSEFKQQDKELSIEGLEHFRNLEDSIRDLSNSYTFVKYVGLNPKLSIADVTVSVYPDIIIRGKKRGKPVVGAIKFHFSKTNELNEDSAKCVTTLIKQFVKSNIAKSEEVVLDELCIVIDIFTEKINTAPRTHVRIMQNVEASCEEIKLRWNEI